MASEELTYLLVGIIILVILIDILIKKRRKSKDTEIEKINEKYLTTFVANGGGMNILKIYLDNKLIFEELN
jgi:hypothetical protein